jgi:hypothetical protein
MELHRCLHDAMPCIGLTLRTAAQGVSPGAQFRDTALNLDIDMSIL